VKAVAKRKQLFPRLGDFFCLSIFFLKMRSGGSDFFIALVTFCNKPYDSYVTNLTNLTEFESKHSLTKKSKQNYWRKYYKTQAPDMLPVVLSSAWAIQTTTQTTQQPPHRQTLQNSLQEA